MTFQLVRTSEIWSRVGSEAFGSSELRGPVWPRFATSEVDGRRLDPFYYSETEVGWIVLLLGTAGVLNRPGTLLFSLLRSERRKKFSLSKGLARNPSLNVYKIAISSEASRRFGNTGKRDLFA